MNLIDKIDELQKLLDEQGEMIRDLHERLVKFQEPHPKTKIHIELVKDKTHDTGHDSL